MEGICDLFYASSWPRFIISIDDKRNKYFENKFSYLRVILFTIQKNSVSISKNEGMVNQDNLHTHKQGITTQLFLANILLKGIEITVCKL